MDEKMETIELRGGSGKVIKLTYEELLKKKDITGKVEFRNGKYYAQVTRWYYLNQEYNSLSEATKATVKLVQKLEKLRKVKNNDNLR